MATEKQETINDGHLVQFIQRIEKLEEEKEEVATLIRDIYTESKSNGFEPKIIRKIIRMRKADPAELEEESALLEVYKRAVGMQS